MSERVAYWQTNLEVNYPIGSDTKSIQEFLDSESIGYRVAESGREISGTLESVEMPWWDFVCASWSIQFSVDVDENGLINGYEVSQIGACL